MKISFAFVACVSFILLFPIVVAECPDNATLGEPSDAYQWPHVPRTYEDFMYREWWFFTLYDETNDLAMVFAYALSDPSKKLGLDHVGVAGMVWPNVMATQGSEEFNFYNSFPFDSFHPSPDSATININGSDNSIEVLDERTYFMKGQSNDGKTKWWLTYKRGGDEDIAAMREVVEVPKLMNLNWINYMPTAIVTGEVEINGVNTTISAGTVGYHDHNYGSWPDPFFNWLWANFGDPKNNFAVTLGAYDFPVVKIYVGYVLFRFHGEHHKLGNLCGDTFSYEPLEFNTTSTGKKYAIHSLVTAESTDWKIVLDFKAKVATLNPGGYGLGLDVFEEVSFYNVTLTDKTLAKEHTFAGIGFNEWSDLLI